MSNVDLLQALEGVTEALNRINETLKTLKPKAPEPDLRSTTPGFMGHGIIEAIPNEHICGHMLDNDFCHLEYNHEGDHNV